MLIADHSVEIFWKAVILLCINSRGEFTQDKFDEYYDEFEYARLGHSSKIGIFLPSHYLSDIIWSWLKKNSIWAHDNTPISLSQKVLECLSYNGSLTLEQLVVKCKTERKDIIDIINNYSIENEPENQSKWVMKSSDMTDQTEFISNFMLHTLILRNSDGLETTYNLSLFGLVLAMSLVTLHYKGADDSTNHCHPNIYYNELNLQEYYDAIANSYKKQLPLIFGRWDFLKAKFGSLLYDSFDFLAFGNSESNSSNRSVWLGGNKEFYDDIRSLIQNVSINLYFIYVNGSETLRKFEQYPDIKRSSRIGVIRKKLHEIEEVLTWIEIEQFLEAKMNRGDIQRPIRFRSDNLNLSARQIETIQTMLGNGLTFSYYLNWNSIIYYSQDRQRKEEERMLAERLLALPTQQTDTMQMSIFTGQEWFRLGSSQERLMTVLAMDKSIKEFFSRYIEDILNYRKITLSKMSLLHHRYSKLGKTIKAAGHPKYTDKKQSRNKDIPLYDIEYDIRKICSHVNL